MDNQEAAKAFGISQRDIVEVGEFDGRPTVTTKDGAVYVLESWERRGRSGPCKILSTRGERVDTLAIPVYVTEAQRAEWAAAEAAAEQAELDRLAELAEQAEQASESTDPDFVLEPEVADAVATVLSVVGEDPEFVASILAGTVAEILDTLELEDDPELTDAVLAAELQSDKPRKGLVAALTPDNEE